VGGAADRGALGPPAAAGSPKGDCSNWPRWLSGAPGPAT